MEKPIVPSPPSVPASKLNLPEGWSVPRPTPWKGSGAEGASSASAAPTGSKDGSILWKAIYFSDLADIVAYFMRARVRSVARPSQAPFAISAAASVSLTARGKPDALVSRPNRTRIHMDMSEPQSHCGGIRGRCFRDHLHMHVHDLVS